MFLHVCSLTIPLYFYHASVDSASQIADSQLSCHNMHMDTRALAPVSMVTVWKMIILAIVKIGHWKNFKFHIMKQSLKLEFYCGASNTSVNYPSQPMMIQVC